MNKSIKLIIALGLAVGVAFGAQAAEKKAAVEKKAVKVEAVKTAKKQAAAKTKKLASAEYKVKGLSCGACEKKLTTALTKLDGVAKPTACSKSNTTKFSFDPKKIKKAQLVAAIEKAGYKVEAEVLNVKVNGLACGACSSKVGKTLTSLKGVKSQEVCHESKKAVVAFDPKKVSSKEVIAAIDKTGFKVVR